MFAAVRLLLLALTMAAFAAPAGATGALLYRDQATDVVKTDYASLWDLTASRSGGGAALRLKKTGTGPLDPDNTHFDPPANANDAGYTGHLRDDATGLNCMQARYYDAAIGRFYSTDPIGYEDQLNLYAYVHNDPVNNIDPNGEERWGINLSFKVAAGKVGFRVSLNANYDTETKEVGASVTAGYRAGAALAAKGEIYVEPSSEQGNQASIEAEVVGEASAEIKAVTGVDVSGEVTAGVSASTKDGFKAHGPEASGSVSKGTASTDNAGRKTYSIGGGAGVAVGVDVTVSGNASVGQPTGQPEPPPPDLDSKR